MIDKLTVQITKTADGQNEYIQVMSGDMLTVNVVLIACKIEVSDQREEDVKKAPDAGDEEIPF